MADAAEVRANIQLVRDLSNELASTLHSFPDEMWRDADRYASACEGWKVADVVTHLIRGSILFELSIRNGLKGDPSPPMGYRKLTREEAVESIVSLRETIGEDLIPEFNVTCLRINEVFQALDHEAYDTPVWHPLEPLTASVLIEFRALELAVHSWDIRYALDRSARLSPGALGFLTGFMSRWFRYGFQKQPLSGSPVTYRFRLNEPITECYDVVVAEDGFEFGPLDDRNADVTFSCDTDAFILFGMGRLPLARSVRRGRISYEGDDELASRFTDWFRPL